MNQAVLRCTGCGSRFGVDAVAADLRPSGREEVQSDETAWSDHWSPANQRRVSQRFFSVYRRIVFARTVERFTSRYFPVRGVLVEAGCGTSETSRWIDKRGGGRTLVALDLLLPVLSRCDPVMDVRLAGDIFKLPFADSSVDGIWNVGVMEHFTHAQIDRILLEFRRVLRPGGRVILLWPGKDSIPQKVLRLAEAVINIRGAGRPFRFHPDEISKLESSRQGRDVLLRNGFNVVEVGGRMSSLLAFRIVIGEKPETAASMPVALTAS